MKGFTVKVSNYEFKVIISTNKEDGSTLIKTGSERREKPCIVCTVTTDDKLVVDFIEYNPNCSDTSDLKRGQGGTVVMLYATLKFITQEYPQIKVVELIDGSTFNCKGYQVNLVMLRLILKKETWYQSIIPGIKTDDDTIQVMAINNKRLDSTVQSIILKKFEIVAKHNPDVRRYFRKINVKLTRVVKDAIESGKTLRQLLIAINEQIGCLFFHYFLHPLLLDISLNKWSVKLENLRPILETLDINVIQTEKPRDFKKTFYGGRGKELKKYSNALLGDSEDLF